MNDQRDFNDEDIPGGPPKPRALYLVYMLDCSGSMYGQKIQSLNYALREVVQQMPRVRDEHPELDNWFVRVITFSNSAKWQSSDFIRVENLEWTDLTADGGTPMGEALKMVSKELTVNRLGKRSLRPVLVLVSDGMPTDNFQEGLNLLLENPYGSKASRIAIAIGEDADRNILRQFISDDGDVLEANNPPALFQYIKYVSTTFIIEYSDIKSKRNGEREILINKPTVNNEPDKDFISPPEDF